ncbi:RNA 2'-phosphotransferase [Chitinophaga niabensis]|uniref:RNA 2'-phosphotransferase n=1 Tax=Chitinophaga niabensis TaxID=536979 RepID=UPI0031BB45F0
MNEQHKKSISKFLSLILRHSPQTIGLQLDENGWADIEELLVKSADHGNPFSRAELEEIVDTNDKRRFAFNDAYTHIRASQGHSVNIDLDLQQSEPPEYLYHGTVSKFLQNIKEEGLLKMSRQHVHLSSDKETATKVGSRRGVPVILEIKSGQMYKEGISFYLSANNVWLTEAVPSQYIVF